ncbi:hypothetical protein JX266_009511 [Neoarthrinium moseri]|nr:hypothetical protein JX266_009511 [Neoarthrinium moseri]
MIAYEQTGLQQIRRVSNEAEQCCNFQTLLVIQPKSEQLHEKASVLGHSITSGALEAASDYDAFNTYALMLNGETVT